MGKKSIPNNPVVLLQQNAQLLRTILSKAGENIPITAIVLLQKNNDEAIRVMETHDKTGDFTIVPKEVVFLCRQGIMQNIGILKKGIVEHGSDQEFVKRANAKIDTYIAIVNRLPTSEKARTSPLQIPPGLRTDVNLSAKTHFDVERKDKV